jgi:hypothetical protein
VIIIDASLILYFTDDNTYTHCYSVFGLIDDLNNLIYTEEYKKLRNIGKALNSGLFKICIFAGDYKTMSDNEIKNRCKEYLE